MLESKPYSIYIPSRAGLGDNIYKCFICPDTVSLIGKIYRAYSMGMVRNVKLVHEDFVNPSMPQVYQMLPFPVEVITTEQQAGVSETGVCNDFPDNITDEFPKNLPEGHCNMYTNCPLEILSLEPLSYALELSPSPVELPQKYAVVAPEAGLSERILYDQAIVEIIRQAGYSAVVVGKQIPRSNMIKSSIVGDIELRDIANIPQTFSIFKNAAFIVSAVSFARLATTLVDTDVIEILPDDSPVSNVEEIQWQYQAKDYGMGEGNNLIMWPSESARLEELISKFK